MPLGQQPPGYSLPSDAAKVPASAAHPYQLAPMAVAQPAGYKLPADAAAVTPGYADLPGARPAYAYGETTLRDEPAPAAYGDCSLVEAESSAPRAPVAYGDCSLQDPSMASAGPLPSDVVYTTE